MQGCQVQEGAGAGIGREGLGNTMDDSLLGIFQSMAHLARLEDCILLFPKRPVSSKNAIVRSPPKRGRIEGCQISLSFPSPCVIGLLCWSAPNFIGALRVTPPFQRKRAVKMLRQCCRNPDHHSKCVPMWAKCWQSRHWPILARSSVRPQAPHSGSLRGVAKRKRYMPENPGQVPLATVGSDEMGLHVVCTNLERRSGGNQEGQPGRPGFRRPLRGT